jgi:hypothetical protein
MAVGSLNTKRRDVVTLWMKQLVNLHERQGTKAPAAAGWMGAIYALRAASRLDGNKEWGRLGDEIISNLEHAYLDVLGADGQKQVEAGRRLLETHHKPTVPTLPTPKGIKRPLGTTRPSSFARPGLRPATASALTRRPAPRPLTTPSSIGSRPLAAGRAASPRPLGTAPASASAAKGARLSKAKPLPPRGSGKAGKARRRG